MPQHPPLETATPPPPQAGAPERAPAVDTPPLRDTDLATLIEPDGPRETAYLVTDNYRAILKYNCSNFYALSVALLADGIIGR